MPTPSTASAFETRIRTEDRTLSARLEKIALPPGHAWRNSASEFTWFGHDVRASTIHGINHVAGPVVASDIDPDQIQVHVRWFWRAREDTPAADQFGRETYRAIVWCQQGPPVAGRHRSLMPGQAGFFNAETIEALADAVVPAIEAALASARLAHAA